VAFQPKALAVFAVFLLGVWLAVGWNQGAVSGEVAAAGLVALLIVDVLVFVGPVFRGDRDANRDAARR